MSDALHLVCPHCHAVNRVPATRLGQQPNCGQCHRPLFTGHPVELTQATFGKHITRSDIPVLVDFWAPWCGPCKQLGPVLEAAINAAGGKVKLAKINIDENPELAQALRIQSVPTVYAFFGGQPVTAFTGVRPQGEIKNLIDQLVKMAQQAKPDALDIPAVLTQAGAALAANDFAAAQDLYTAILSQDENNAAAYTGLVRTFIAAGHVPQARMMVDDAPDAIKTNPQFTAAKTALELAETPPAGGNDIATLQEKLKINPDDHQARFDLALALFARGEKETAMDELIAIIRRNRVWEEDKARLQLVKFFDALGPADPATASGRRKLSSVLFS